MVQLTTGSWISFTFTMDSGSGKSVGLLIITVLSLYTTKQV